MSERYPGYDVLAKRDTPSWNEATRRAIDARLALPREPRFLSEDEFATLSAIAARIVPQPDGRPPIPVAALVDHKLDRNAGDGYRNAKLPRLREAWRHALAAFDAEARNVFGVAFSELRPDHQVELLRRAEKGELKGPGWAGMPSGIFFQDRLLRDILHAYYAHPTSWNEIGYGGPASPRGYVRMGYNRRDPWEAEEAQPGCEDDVRRRNRNVG